MCSTNPPVISVKYILKEVLAVGKLAVPLSAAVYGRRLSLKLIF